MDHYSEAPVNPAALPFALPFALASAAAGFWEVWVLCVTFGLLAAFVLWFFRNPSRTAAEPGEVVVSPADGKVTDVTRLEDGRLRFSIFLSVFNVHINCMPCAGVVAGIQYNHGLFLNAMSDKASLRNEQNCIRLDTHWGPVDVVQIAGWIARRIVCWVEEGAEVKAGERFGLIRFGSRVDVTLPAAAAPAVAVGAKVAGGHTVLARWEANHGG